MERHGTNVTVAQVRCNRQSSGGLYNKFSATDESCVNLTRFIRASNIVLESKVAFYGGATDFGHQKIA